MGMAINRSWWLFDRLLQSRHDPVNARGKRFGLLGTDVMLQSIDTGVPCRIRQKSIPRYMADSHHRGILKVAKSFHVFGAFNRIGRCIAPFYIDCPIPDHIHHSLIFAHRIHQRMRRVEPAEIKHFCGRNLRQVGAHLNPLQPLQWIGAKMKWPILGRKKS